MSAPQTNIEKQEKQHKAPLLGMGASVFWALGLLVLLVGYIMFNGTSDDGEAKGPEQVPPAAAANQ